MTSASIATTDSMGITQSQSDDILSNCIIGSVWIVRLTGLYSERQLNVMGGYESDTIENSSVSCEVIHHNESSLVLKVQGLGLMIQLPTSRVHECLSALPFHKAECSTHYSPSAILALQESFALADQVRLQLLLMVLRDSPCFVSEHRWSVLLKRAESDHLNQSRVTSQSSSQRGSYPSRQVTPQDSLKNDRIGDDSTRTIVLNEGGGGVARGCGMCSASCGVFFHSVYVTTFRRHQQYRQ
eukprot:gene24032-30328_t